MEMKACKKKKIQHICTNDLWYVWERGPSTTSQLLAHIKLETLKLTAYWQQQVPGMLLLQIFRTPNNIDGSFSVVKHTLGQAPEQIFAVRCESGRPLSRRITYSVIKMVRNPTLGRPCMRRLERLSVNCILIRNSGSRASH